MRNRKSLSLSPSSRQVLLSKGEFSFVLKGNELRRVFEAGNPRQTYQDKDGTSLFASAGFHVGPQERVDLSLITLALRSEPLEHVHIQP